MDFKWRQLHDEIIKLGGLYVVVPKARIRRIDNQLRGRSAAREIWFPSTSLLKMN